MEQQDVQILETKKSWHQVPTEDVACRASPEGAWTKQKREEEGKKGKGA